MKRALLGLGMGVLLTVGGIALGWVVLRATRGDAAEASGGEPAGLPLPGAEGDGSDPDAHGAAPQPAPPPLPEPETVAAPADAGPGRAELVALNAEALGLLDARDFAGAVEGLERCVAGDPDEAIFARNLGVALMTWASATIDSADAAERAAALERGERALGYLTGEELAALRARLETWRAMAAAEADFFTYGNERFELAYDGDREGLREHEDTLLQQLDRAYQEFGERFGAFPLEGRRLRVVLYTSSEFDELTGLGHWAGGVFDGTIRVPVQNLDLQLRSGSLERVLRHELCHAFVDRVGGRDVPAWLNEGLAQWLEPVRGQRSGAVDLARRRLRERLAGGQALVPLADLTGAFTRLPDQAAIRNAYAQSLAVVDHLARHYGDAVVLELVQGCAESRPVDRTFATRVGLQLPVVVGDLTADLQQGD